MAVPEAQRFEAVNEVVKWPDAMTPSRSPIHFTNELEVAVPADTIWSLLVSTTDRPRFYPGVEHVRLPDGHHVLRLGTRFEINRAGQDVSASVVEFESMTRIAWYGGPVRSEASKAYRVWILTPAANGTHLRSEETMRGPLWIEMAEQEPDVFRRSQEKLLRGLADVALERQGALAR